MKKYLKRAVSIICALAMLMTIVTAGAESSVTLTVGNEQLTEGDTVNSVTIPVSISNNTGLAGVQIKIAYDSGLTLTGIEAGDALNGLTFTPGGDLSANPINLMWAGKDADFTNGVAAKLIFEVPTEKAQEYEITVSYNVGDIYDNDLNDVDVTVVNGKISVAEKPKQNMTGITLSDKTFTYDGKEKSIAVSGTLPSGATVSYENEKATDAGEYNVKATVKADGYNDLVLTAKMIINPKNLTVSGLKAENKIYDGTDSAIVSGGELSGVVTGDDVNAEFPTAGTFAKSDAGMGVSVSISDITLTGSDKDNYTLTQPTGLKADISKATITVTAEDKTKKVGAEDPALTYTYEGSLVGDDNFTGELSRQAGEKVGKYDILIGTLYVSDNYDITYNKAVFEIVDKTPQNITVSEITQKTYGDAGFKVEVTADSTSNLTDFTFESSNTDVAEIEADGSVTIKAAGETNITVKQAGNDEYAPFEKTQKLVVDKKSVMVTEVNIAEKTVLIDGVLAEDSSVAVDFNKLTLEMGEAIDETSTKVTVKNFVLTGEKAENYVVTTKSVESSIATENLVSVTISAADGTVTGAGSYIKGSSVTLTANANRGYSFSGWYFNDALVSNNQTYTFTAESDINLEARFTKKASGGLNLGGGGSDTVYYSVKFETNGANVIADKKVKSGSAVAEPEAPAKEGYVFKGWYLDSELKNSYDFASKVTKGITLYAAWEEDISNKIILTINEKSASVFGKEKENDVAPIIRNDRTMLPARFVAECLGAKVEWNEEARTVIITKDDIKIVIAIDSDTALVNDKEIKLDSPAFIENDRTYTPIRFIAENLGAQVEWNENSQKVIITK